MSQRKRNDGVRKLCECVRRTWPKCPHPWHFNFKPKGTPEHFRFSLERRVEKLVRGDDGKWRRGKLGRPITSKTEAEQEADRLRTGIRDGSLLEAARPVLERLTLGELLAAFEREYLVRERAASSLRNAKYQISAIKRTIVSLHDGVARPFGDCLVVDIKTGTVLQFRAARSSAGLVATNRDLALLRACFNWAIRVEYLDRTPFKRGTEAVVKLARELQRRRRLEAGEADRLLAACTPPRLSAKRRDATPYSCPMSHLRALVEAALETGMRKGELLSLQWHQVRAHPRAELVLPAQKTKTKRDRRIPISTRLQAILDMRRTAPDGVEHPPSAYVFGNEIGQRVKRVTRAWEAAVLRTHGHRPEYRHKGSRGLTAASRAQLRAIDLHFHDLRREAGSRWLDGGVPLHTIRDWLGHANISQTSTYLESTIASQHGAMREYEARLQRIATEGGKGDQTRPVGSSVATVSPEKSPVVHH